MKDFKKLCKKDNCKNISWGLLEVVVLLLLYLMKNNVYCMNRNRVLTYIHNWPLQPLKSGLLT